MNDRMTCLLVLAACVGAASAAAAQAPDDFARNGPYLGVAGTVGIFTELNNELDQFDNDGEVDPTLGVNARAGYRLHPHFATEAQFEWLAKADVDGGFFFSDTEVGPTWLVTANAKGFILTGRVQPYALLGLGYMSVDGDAPSDGQFAARLGGGVDIYITPHILGTLGASYVIPDDDLHDFAYVSVVWGLGYRF